MRVHSLPLHSCPGCWGADETQAQRRKLAKAEAESWPGSESDTLSPLAFCFTAGFLQNLAGHSARLVRDNDAPPLGQMGWQDPGRVKSGVGEKLTRMLCGFWKLQFPKGHLILSTQKTVPDKEGMDDTSHQVPQKLALSVVGPHTDMSASLRNNHFLLVTTVFSQGGIPSVHETVVERKVRS